MAKLLLILNLNSYVLSVLKPVYVVFMQIVLGITMKMALFMGLLFLFYRMYKEDKGAGDWKVPQKGVQEEEASEESDEWAE